MSEYKDFDLKMSKHPVTGDISTRTDARAIMQSIREIVLTRAGDWPADPRFGVGIWSQLGENMHALISENYRRDIVEAIEFYEPRAEIKSVTVVPYEDHGLKVTVVFFALNHYEPYTQEIKFDKVR